MPETKRVGRAGWDLDLEHGQLREGALAEILALRYGSRIEIKSDGKCRQTGNLFLEYEQPTRDGGRQLSGIAASEADWWAFEYYDDCWIVLPRAVVLRLARRAFSEGRTKRGGDDYQYLGVLVPLEWLLDVGSLA